MRNGNYSLEDIEELEKEDAAQALRTFEPWNTKDSDAVKYLRKVKRREIVDCLVHARLLLQKRSAFTTDYEAVDGNNFVISPHDARARAWSERGAVRKVGTKKKTIFAALSLLDDASTLIRESEGLLVGYSLLWGSTEYFTRPDNWPDAHAMLLHTFDIAIAVAEGSY